MTPVSYRPVSNLGKRVGMNLTVSAQSVAEHFVAARRDARALAEYPGVRPENLAQAYAIQDKALAIDDRTVVGWKVGRINAPLDVQLGSNRLAGPIFSDSVVFVKPAECPDMPVYAGGFAAGEAEMLLHVKAGWDGRVPANDAETLALLDDIRLGIEIASSPYSGINADGPAVTVSDYGNNAGLVIGEPIADFAQVDLCAIEVQSLVDGREVGRATAATMLDGPLGAVRFILGNLSDRGIDVSAGSWISTGAITGVHQVAIGQRFTAVFVGQGAIECNITEAQPR